MKKTLYLFISLLLCFALFACTQETPVQADTWDGTVADSFAKGKGTKKAPFIIETGEQLALMSKEINAGNYTDAYFTLGNDIDLNGHEWIPIGNGDSFFCGSFDGSGHTVTGLSITKACKFSVQYEAGKIDYGVAGLFGVCCDSDIKNLTIRNASVSGEIMGSGKISATGVLSGMLCESTSAGSGCTFYNVKILDSHVLTPNDDKRGGMAALGGITGYSSAPCRLEGISVSLEANTVDKEITNTFIGGLIGNATKNSIECQNASIYMTALCQSNEYLNCGSIYIGAFGQLNPTAGDLNISNVYSKITANEKSFGLLPYGGNTRIINPIAGTVLAADNADITFKNLFGYVALQGDADERGYELYSFLRKVDYNEVNCFGCEALPEDHGFDTDVWDVNDKTAPFVK